MTMPAHCSVATLAKMLNLSERRIYQLAKKGIILKVKSRQYDIVGSIQAYKQFIRESDNKATSDYQQQKTRLVKIQADHAALTLACAQAKLLDAKTVKRLWHDNVIKLRTILLHYPAYLSAQIMALSPLSHAIIDHCIQIAMTDALAKITRLPTDFEAAAATIRQDHAIHDKEIV